MIRIVDQRTDLMLQIVHRLVRLAETADRSITQINVPHSLYIELLAERGEDRMCLAKRIASGSVAPVYIGGARIVPNEEGADVYDIRVFMHGGTRACPACHRP